MSAACSFEPRLIKRGRVTGILTALLIGPGLDRQVVLPESGSSRHLAAKRPNRECGFGSGYPQVRLCDTGEASANAVCGSLSDLATNSSIPATGEAVNSC